jgi:hypothetical protein
MMAATMKFVLVLAMLAPSVATVAEKDRTIFW